MYFAETIAEKIHKRLHKGKKKQQITTSTTEQTTTTESDFDVLQEVDDPLIDQNIECTELEYEKLKSSLLQYHCVRIGEQHCLDDSKSKPFMLL